MRPPELLHLYPSLRDALGWIPLVSGPTPVEPAGELGDRLGCPNLWLKREDRSAPDHGGSKVRKLEWLLGEATRRRSRSVVSVGAVGSNHVVATSFYARLLGMESHAVVVPQPMHDDARRNLAAALGLGCQLRFARSAAHAAWLLGALTGSRWAREGRAPYVMGPGGSSPRGVLGFVEVGLEIAAQVRAGQMPKPAFAFVPLASCGTLAGLALGLRLAALDTVPVGVRVCDRAIANAATVVGLGAATARLLEREAASFPRVRLRRSDIVVLHDHAGAGYAHATSEAAGVLALARRYAGLELEPTYSSKALAGLAAFMKRPSHREQVALFICTFNTRPLDAALASCPPPEAVAPELRGLLPAGR